MKERGIIFNSEMVNAILQGRKTQTRRPLDVEKLFYKVRPFSDFPIELRPCNHSWMGKRVSSQCPDCYNKLIVKCPYGKVGDILYVRETWKKLPDGKIGYAASPETCKYNNFILFSNWKPSIHMKKEYSRIKLKITDIRIERVQDISESDAVKEGVKLESCYNQYEPKSYSDSFLNLFSNIYGDENLWVWVIEFEVIK